MQLNQYGPFNVFQSSRQLVAIDLMIDIVKNQIAVAIGEGYLEAWLNKQTSAPSGILLWRCRSGEIEGGPFRKALRCGEIFVAPNMLAPIDVLQHVFV